MMHNPLICMQNFKSWRTRSYWAEMLFVAALAGIFAWLLCSLIDDSELRGVALVAGMLISNWLVDRMQEAFSKNGKKRPGSGRGMNICAGGRN